MSKEKQEMQQIDLNKLGLQELTHLKKQFDMVRKTIQCSHLYRSIGYHMSYIFIFLS